jgi:hypothetical protein
METIFFSSFCMVFLLGIQQQNIVHGHYFYSAITSMCIAMVQVLFIQGVATGEYWTTVIPLGLGGAIGASCSMLFHRKILRRNK